MPINVSSAMLYLFLACAVLVLGGILPAVQIAAFRDTDFVVALKTA